MQSMSTSDYGPESTRDNNAVRQERDSEQNRFRYRGRVRTGCITCRKRKIKCDEGQPSCSKCVRASATCIYQPIKRLHRHGDAKVISATADAARSASSSRQALAAAADVQEAISALSRKVYQPPATPSSLAELISQDIQITTTMDLLAVGNPESLNYFLDELHFPMISAYDGPGWSKAKMHVVELAKTCPVVTAAAHALQMMHRSQRYGLPLTGAVSLYASAKECLEVYAGEIRNPVDSAIVAAFCLAVFDVIRCEPESVLLKPTDALVGRFRQWHGQRHQSPHSIRIGLWLRIMHVGANRGGGPGLASKDILAYLPPDCEGLRSDVQLMSDIESHHESLFRFYFNIQMIATDVQPLSHYARSRIRQSDQVESLELLNKLRRRLEGLWNSRPECITMTPAELRQRLSFFDPDDVDSVLTLGGIVIAEYHGQHIEISRAISNPPRIDTLVDSACIAIRTVVESQWNPAYPDGTVSCGYLRPLLQYVIECFNMEQTEWAVSLMNSMRDPICRSDFFATYAEQLSHAQIAEDRRVTMKYFCLRVFATPLPFY